LGLYPRLIKAKSWKKKLQHHLKSVENLLLLGIEFILGDKTFRIEIL
jgi:hypothetical protein